MNKTVQLKKGWILILIALLFQLNLIAQDFQNTSALSVISIEECYEWARENYPVVKQLDLIDRSTDFSLNNASKGNLPQININGQATYQSDVTGLPIDIPGADIPAIAKDQYKVYAEVYQPLTNFSTIKSAKKQLANNGLIEKQKLEVDLYKLKERVNQIYFGILLIDAKIDQLTIIQSDLDSTTVKVEAAVENGTATITDVQLLKVESLSLTQRIDENLSNRSAFTTMLATLTGKNITLTTELSRPASPEVTNEISRPELELFSLQNQGILLQNEQISKRLIPNIGLFLQGGYGRPALNFLSNDFSAYYITGLKFNWNLSKLYTSKNDKQVLELSLNKVINQKETFLLNTTLTSSQQSKEAEKFKTLINSDQEIIALRQTIKETAQVQLSNGLITTLDYIRFINDIDKARQSLVLHQTQLLLSQFNLKTTTGN